MSDTEKAMARAILAARRRSAGARKPSWTEGDCAFAKRMARDPTAAPVGSVIEVFFDSSNGVRGTPWLGTVVDVVPTIERDHAPPLLLYAVAFVDTPTGGVRALALSTHRVKRLVLGDGTPYMKRRSGRIASRRGECEQ